MKGDRLDPKALIREAYRIEGIGAEECRSIFVDWALSLPDDLPAADALPGLIARHGTAAPDHPMTAVMRAGLAPGGAAQEGTGQDGTGRPARRGGWRARRDPAAGG